jgi:ferrochelatase
MSNDQTCYIIANFGGPRTLTEINPFLTSLLTDKDVVRTGMPQWLHSILFKRIAKKRTLKVSKDYEQMGGCSPIYADTEAVASKLSQELNAPVLTFHRYLPATHAKFIQKLAETTCTRITVFPMFPQFTYATTGSIARWFSKNLPEYVVNKMRWVKSYPSHPSFVRSYTNCIKDFLHEKQIMESDAHFLFSAHGIPAKFVATGDLYQSECESSFNAIMKAFPASSATLAYQSKFGPGEWLKPYTVDVSEGITERIENKKHVLFVPISFTSDHIETLVEIENDYLPLITKQNLQAHRVPALNHRADWMRAIVDIIAEENYCANQMLVRS